MSEDKPKKPITRRMQRTVRVVVEPAEDVGDVDQAGFVNGTTKRIRLPHPDSLDGSAGD